MSESQVLSVRHPLVERVVKWFGGRAVTPADLAGLAADSRLPEGWAGRELAGYVNDPATAVFLVPLASMSGAAGIHIAQEIWMLQPTVFDYVTLGDKAVVRLWWDGDAGAGPDLRASR